MKHPLLRKFLGSLVALAALAALPGCFETGGERGPQSEPPRLVMFIGVDVSGSFVNSKYFEDSLDFLSDYLYAHLNGVGGLEVPHSLFVGTLGGDKLDEAKTFFPIETFQNRSPEEIRKKVKELFLKKTKSNALTDFNAFFQQVEATTKNRRLILKPISILMLSDGKPDIPGVKGNDKFRKIDLSPLEMLSRNVTLRLLYTDAVTGRSWQTLIPRKRVKIWTQDASVMVEWKSPKIFLADKPFPEQTRFFDWIRDNVDFSARVQRVDR
jgi:hypothetical protein